MKKEHKLPRQLCFAILPCVAAALLSGCSNRMLSSMVGYDMNPKVYEVDREWVAQFAVPGKTKDVDILRRLCKPTQISQYSNGEKSYAFWDGSHSWLWRSFDFGPDHLLTRTYPSELVESSSAQIDFGDMEPEQLGATSDKELLALLETLPRKTTPQILRKKLGNPFYAAYNKWTYSIRTAGIPFFWSEMKKKERWAIFSFRDDDGWSVEYMVVPKAFYEYAMEHRAHFNINMVYAFERSPDEQESAAIANCEK